VNIKVLACQNIGPASAGSAGPVPTALGTDCCWWWWSVCRIRDAGVKCPSVGLGATPTASQPSPLMTSITELHPGNYVFYGLVSSWPFSKTFIVPVTVFALLYVSYCRVPPGPYKSLKQ